MEIFNRTLTDVDVTIYDYKQKSRDEQVLERMHKEYAVKEVDRKKFYKMIKKRKAEAEERFKKNGHRRY